MTDIIKRFKHELEKVQKLPTKPSLLLHTCCAMCFSSSFLQIKDYFRVTVYYFNPNIYPLEEYEKRKNEVLRLIDIFEKEYQVKIDFIEEKKDFNDYLQCKIHQKGCQDCLHLRLLYSFQYAMQHHYDYVTTTLTLGRLKDSSLINSLAYSLQPMFPTIHYLYSDFKKNKGIDLSLQCKEKYSIYAQCYCGCEKYGKKD